MRSRVSRIENNIIKFSPKWTKAYQNWIKKGKPNQFTAYLLHDKKLKVKKLGISTKVWARVFNGLNHRYFFNFNLLANYRSGPLAPTAIDHASVR